MAITISDPSLLAELLESGDAVELRDSQGKVLGRFEAELAVRPLPKALRPVGLCAGEFTVPDDFDAPLPEEILREFEGS